MPIGERLAPGFDDMGGRGEIGLADTEIDDRAALSFERLGARQDLEGGFGAELAHAAGEGEHRRVRWWRVPSYIAEAGAADKSFIGPRAQPAIFGAATAEGRVSEAPSRMAGSSKRRKKTAANANDARGAVQRTARIGSHAGRS